MKKQVISREDFSREELAGLTESELCLVASGILADSAEGNGIYFLTNLARHEDSLYRKTLDSSTFSTYSTTYAKQVINLHDIQKMLKLLNEITDKATVDAPTLSKLKGFALEYLQLYREGKDTPQIDKALDSFTDLLYDCVSIETKTIPVFGYTKEKVVGVSALTVEQLEVLKQSQQTIEASLTKN